MRTTAQERRASKRKTPAKPNPKQRRYSEEQKASALAAYREHGPREAERRVKVPWRTICRWAAAAGVSTDVTAKTAAATDAAKARMAEKRARLQEEFLDTALDALARRSQVHIEVKVVSDGAEAGSHVELVKVPLPSAAAVRDYVIAAATALDKVRLEAGEATDRREVHVDDARERIRGRLAAISGRESGSVGP